MSRALTEVRQRVIETWLMRAAAAGLLGVRIGGALRDLRMELVAGRVGLALGLAAALLAQTSRLEMNNA